MSRWGELITFDRGKYERHKGFYNDNDPEKTLCHIRFSEYFTMPDDDNFVYDDAHPLLRGSCHLFALSLSKVLGYCSYIIEGKAGGFHSFCQVYKNHQHFYIDARGVTTSFDEFMDVAGDFVNDEFIVRKITPQDIEEWENNEDYYEEALAFAEAVIRDYEECYRV